MTEYFSRVIYRQPSFILDFISREGIKRQEQGASLACMYHKKIRIRLYKTFDYYAEASKGLFYIKGHPLDQNNDELIFMVKETVDNSYSISEIEVDSSWTADLGETYRAYREKWVRATEDHHLFEFPLFLEVGTVYACNYSCPMCPAVILDAHNNFRKLPEPLFEKLVTEFLAILENW